jgi:hypothetical protein
MIAKTLFLLLLMDEANIRFLVLSTLACLLAAFLVSLLVLRGRPGLAVLLGTAQAGAYLALVMGTRGEWAWVLNDAARLPLSLAGAPALPDDWTGRLILFAIPAALHGLLFGGLAAGVLLLARNLRGSETPSPSGRASARRVGRPAGKKKAGRPGKASRRR